MDSLRYKRSLAGGHSWTQTEACVCVRRTPCSGRALRQPGHIPLQPSTSTNLLATSVACKVLPLLEVDSATVVSVLKGPTISEMLGYGRTAVSFAGTAWQAAVAPFAIFGTDHWGLNLLFYFAVLIMGYNLIVQAPKQ